MANDWTVRSDAWLGGHEVKRDRGLDPKEMATKGRFLLRAVDREERIAHTLFEKAHSPFEEAISLVDMIAIEQEVPSWIIPKAKPFWEQLGLYSEKSGVTDEEYLALDDLAKKRFWARWTLSRAIREWAEEWRLDWGIIFYFATAVLIEGPPRRLPRAVSPLAPGPISGQDRRNPFATPVSAWEKVAEDYLRAALSEMVPQEAKEVCLTAPAGFELYAGRGAEEYIARQIKNIEPWLMGQPNFSTPLAGLPLPYKKQIREWVREIGAEYCERVDAALAVRGAKKKRIEPTFARDIEWAVERRILNWGWERIAKASGKSMDVVKKGVRKILELLELPLAPSFDEPKGLHRK